MNQIEWAAWGPTIVTALTCIFFAGVMWNKTTNVEKRVDQHDDKFDSHEEKFKDDKNEMDLIKSAAALQATAIGRLEAWRDGWNAARATYDKNLAHGGD